MSFCLLLSLSLTLSVSLSLCLYVPLSLCLSVTLSLPVSVCLCLSLSVSLSLCLCFFVSLSLSLSLCLPLCLFLSLCLDLSLACALLKWNNWHRLFRIKILSLPLGTRPQWNFTTNYNSVPDTSSRRLWCNLVWQSAIWCLFQSSQINLSTPALDRMITCHGPFISSDDQPSCPRFSSDDQLPDSFFSFDEIRLLFGEMTNNLKYISFKILVTNELPRTTYPLTLQ